MSIIDWRNLPRFDEDELACKGCGRVLLCGGPCCEYAAAEARRYLESPEHKEWLRTVRREKQERRAEKRRKRTERVLAKMSSEPVFPILQWPIDAALLRRVARPIRDDEFGTPELVEFGKTLAITMMRANGLGLASTQVADAPGGEPWSMFALRISPSQYGLIHNPEIRRVGGWAPADDGCLSFASVPVPVSAPTSIGLAARRSDGTEFEAAYDGEMAQYVYHEVRHLDWWRIDRVGGSMARADFMRRVAKARRQKK